MTGADNHESWAELVVGRALDALEPGDDARLTSHLPTCAPCRELLAEMHAVAASMAYDAVVEEPPVELLDRIRAALPDVDASATVFALADHPRRRLLKPGRRPLTAVAAGIAAAALVAAGAGVVQLHGSNDRARHSLAAESTIIANLAHGSAYSVPLRSSGPSSGAAVVSGRTVSLVTDGLDRNNSADSVYVLWAAAGPGQTMRAVRGFDVTTSGVTVVTATLPSDMGAPTIFGVTEERGRALPSVPGTVILGTSSASQA
jgi:hypothetical protein